MSTATKKEAPKLMVILAFATVYLVWGSTYFFIQKAVEHVPPFILGATRFFASGIILLLWCIIKKEKLWNWKTIKVAAITGVMLLFIGNGAVIWSEQNLPSSLVAVLISSAPLWFVLLDKPRWRENFRSSATITGLIIGFIGVILLFGERISSALSSPGSIAQITGFAIVIIGTMSWAGGSLFSKYKSSGSALVNSTWQMIAAAIAFIIVSAVNNEWSGFQWKEVTTLSWLSVLYLIIMGSLVAYSAYVWLLQVRPAAQVSTYAYVNPVVAVLLGVFFAGEQMSFLQIAGLAIILTSVLLINLAKQRMERRYAEQKKTMHAKAA